MNMFKSWSFDSPSAVRSLVIATAAVPLLALCAACGTSNNTSSAAVSEISITPSPCGVGKGDTISAHAQATLPDGSKEDITSSAGVEWTSSNTNTLTVTNTGIVVGVSAGITNINVAYLGATASLGCTVTP